MLHASTAAQVRSAEAPLLASLPPGTLMQRAAYGLARVCARELDVVYGSHVALLVGGGDNGADALWAGVLLRRRGVRVTAVLAAEPRADALGALRAAGGRVLDGRGPDGQGPDGRVLDGPGLDGQDPDGRVPGGRGAEAPTLVAQALATADLVVDGLVGIGGRGALRPAAAGLVALVRAPVVAVDLPSGVDADTGEVAGAAVRADLTVSFGAYKTGCLVGDGARRVGRLELVPVGLGRVAADVEVLEAADVAALLPRAVTPADKYTRGVVGIAAGSDQYTGAAVLATTAAVRAGAGMVRFAGVDQAAQQVRAARPEVVVTTVAHGDGVATVGVGRVQAWVLGPGLGTGDEGHAVVAAVLATDVPVLVDADALTVLARDPGLVRGRSAPTLLTPHDRELARFRDLGPDRVGAARALAADLGVTVLLKGDATVVADPAGRVRVNRTGSVALATAGTGDVLSGGCGALLAAGLSALDAGSVGAWLHGRAGQLAAAGATTHALEVAQRWPDAVREALAAARGV